jgi:magnesium-transporting ATPase (P-type)
VPLAFDDESKSLDNMATMNFHQVLLTITFYLLCVFAVWTCYRTSRSFIEGSFPEAGLWICALIVSVVALCAIHPLVDFD